MDIYREEILANYQNPKNFGRLKKADVSYKASSPFCGDTIGIDIKVEKGSHKIKKIKFWGEGCAISFASASMLTEKVKGATIEEIKKLKYKDIQKMLGVDLSPIRIKCALLPLEVLQKILTLI